MYPHAAHIVFDSAPYYYMLGLDVTSKADIRAGLCSPLEEKVALSLRLLQKCVRICRV